jgi:hypothetical protein
MGNNKRMLFEIVLAVFYPFDLERLKNNVACLIVEEIGDLGGGFRVVAGDVKSVDSLPDERKQEFYAFFNLLEKNDDIVAIVLFQIKSLKSFENFEFIEVWRSFGPIENPNPSDGERNGFKVGSDQRNYNGRSLIEYSWLVSGWFHAQMKTKNFIGS